MSTLSQFFSSGSTARPISFFMIGGGGSAGGNNTVEGAGGGGAGGAIRYTNYPVPTGVNYTIVIGGGGASVNYTNSSGKAGSNTVFLGLIAYGGGAGGVTATDKTGGCGGGGSPGASGGNPTQPNYSSNFTGGEQTISYGTYGSGGPSSTGVGGGGGGIGGNGYVSGSTQVRGPGLTWLDGNTYGTGGVAQGSSAGAANTGNGGSNGYQYSNGEAGGSGIVVIMYPDSYPAPAAITGTYSQPTISGYRVYRFTGSGSITF